ncbi:MAG: S8 family serine peptidase [Acidobacteria bacterium]|nr:S8 family serine peptidase [Acidobacteriota bacterium]
MKEKYVILRESSTRRRGSGAGAASAGAETVKVEIDELDRRSSRAVAAKKGVKAVAPVIPMRLIAPVPQADDDAQAAATTAWGISAVKADVSPFDGSDVVVAVLDTGIAAGHPAFAGVDVQEEDFTGEGNGDTHGHGTHCAGTIFGQDVNGTRIGIARNVKKALIGKVLGDQGGGGSDAILKAINWAVEEGANVISMSLGIDFPGFVDYLINEQNVPADLATTMALEGYRQNVLLFERLASVVKAQEPFGQTTIIIAAAGNESRRSENADFEIACSPPAVSEGLISVAALGLQGSKFRVAPFSNTNVLVSGPGVGVLSARHTGGLVAMSGTSMATPHVAGVAALWMQRLAADGDVTGAQLTARLIASGVRNDITGAFDVADVGSGMVQCPI